MEILKKCPRCMGRGKMFAINGGWSMMDTGGKELDCPMCLGKIFVKDVKKEVKEKLTESDITKPKSVKKKVTMGKPKKQSAKSEGVCT